MMNKLSTVIIIYCVAFITACTDRGTTIDFSVNSNITGIEYPIHVNLPPGYESNTDDYPVLYATDGQWRFNEYVDAIRSKNKEIILVSIEQGPDGRRSNDYLLPGAHQYYEFLMSELLPQIESEYRINKNERSLAGSSFGGVFVGLVILMEGEVIPNFKNYLAFDPSFWVSPSLLIELEKERYDKNTGMDLTLMLTSAKPAGNDEVVTKFQLLLEARGYSGLNIIRKTYGVTHSEITPPSLTDAMNLFD